MNKAKLLTLLSVAAMALLALAGTASATTLTTPKGTTPTSTTTAEGHVVLDNPIAKIECNSSAEGTVASHGAGVTAKVNLTALSFTNCTNSWHVTVVTPGTLEVHATGGGNGTVTTNGATVEATRFGITCRYATLATDIGTVTGGSPGTLDVNAAIPFHSGSGLCGSGATTWTGSYIGVAGGSLTVDS